MNFNTSKGLRKWSKRIRYLLFKLGISLSPPVYFEWLQTLQGNENSKIADIGCGNGQLLEELSYNGFKNLHGYDPFLLEDKYSERIQLKKMDYYDINEKYDIVMFHHAFEHISNPVRVFEKLVTILNPGGKALIRVPVTDGQVWKESREFWFQLDAPRHLFIPNTKSLQILATKFDLDLYSIKFDSFECQFWGTELYKRGKILNGLNITEEFSQQELNNFKRKSIEYNKMKIGDQACFYFKLK
ncbi:class I SAM-dependent methyltransferase [Algoriphagus ratkowskyi]|uniref:class I SAM-dependent methyltransferase n=1 Tax=Algoriphagus ratkowskyi TaxID=57028 RepID=UPI0013026A0F|nr:class I SAM-dependent methyltransferase [Algoriphagus ratkowskyi]